MISDKAMGRAIGAVFAVQIAAVVLYVVNLVKVVIGAIAVESWDSVASVGIPLIIQAVGVVIPPLGVIAGLVIW